MNKTQKEIWMPDGTKLNVILERAADGTYACYPESEDISASGYGRTAEIAIGDFVATYKNLQEEIKNDTFPRDKVERFKEIAKEMGDLYEKKNKAYGDSFGDTYKRLGIISAITRISDKYNRLCQLATKPEIDDLGERIQDTLMDLANYSVMTIMEIESGQNG